LEEVVAVNEECGGEIFLLHDVMSNDADDPSVAVARKLDWEEFCSDLPAREKAVVEFLVEGASGSAIARKLRVCDSTIQTIKRHLPKALVDFMGFVLFHVLPWPQIHRLIQGIALPEGIQVTALHDLPDRRYIEVGRDGDVAHRGDEDATDDPDDPDD
jgi:hypothetical protein